MNLKYLNVSKINVRKKNNVLIVYEVNLKERNKMFIDRIIGFRGKNLRVEILCLLGNVC